MIAADQKGLFLNLRALQDEFLDRVQAISGKPVVLQSDGNFAGHAVIRMATKEHPAHVLLYKPEHQSLLPYLVAFQCELALRTFLASPPNTVRPDRQAGDEGRRAETDAAPPQGT